MPHRRLADGIEDSVVRKYDDRILNAIDGVEIWRFLLQALQSSAYRRVWSFYIAPELEFREISSAFR